VCVCERVFMCVLRFRFCAALSPFLLFLIRRCMSVSVSVFVHVFVHVFVCVFVDVCVFVCVYFRDVSAPSS